MKKDHKIQIFVGCLGVAGTILGAIIGNMYGIESQDKYVKSQIANVSGEGNTVNMISVDDLVKNYNKLSEENEKLKKQNDQYFDENKSLKEQIETTKNNPSVELKNMGLFINEDEININKNNAHAIINGTEYFSKDIISNLVSEDTTITIQNNTMFIGKVIADKANLFSQYVMDDYHSDFIDSATDSYGNKHINVLRIRLGSDVIFNLNKKYSFLRFKIAADEFSGKNYDSIVSIFADEQEVETISSVNAMTEELVYNDIDINNCTRLEIKCTGASSVSPIIYDAEVYN